MGIPLMSTHLREVVSSKDINCQKNVLQRPEINVCRYVGRATRSDPSSRKRASGTNCEAKYGGQTVVNRESRVNRHFAWAVLKNDNNNKSNNNDNNSSGL